MVKNRKISKEAREETVSTDEEVLQRRVLVESFESSDLMLGVFGWALWGVAFVWFLYFGQGTLTWLPSDPVIVLAGCGWLCTGMSRSSPKDTWSSWRIVWQMLWVPAWGLLALAMAQVAISPLGAFIDHGWNYAPFSAILAWIWTGLLAACAGATFYFLPKGSPNPKEQANAPMARLLFLANMAYGCLAAFFAVTSAPWGTGLGPQGALFAAVPFAMWGLGTGLCTTPSEMVKALPGAILIHLGAVCRVLMFGNGGGFLVLLTSVGMLVAHLALFLPLPLNEPESNIFYLYRLKMQKHCYTMISNPVSDFGDDQ